MPMKRKKPAHQEQNLEENKVRRVIIDSDSDEQQEEGSGGRPEENGEAKIIEEEGEEIGDGEEVVDEVDIFLLPVDSSEKGPNGESFAGLNRIQFPQQHPKLLEGFFAEDGEFGGKCRAHYKSQVRHLKLQFGEGEEEKVRENSSQMNNNSQQFGNGRSSQNCEGIVDLLMRSPSSSSSTISAAPSTPKAKKDSTIFMGEGCSQHGVFSHAVGFFNQGKLFFLPIDKTYEMRKPLEGSSEKEAAKSAQKAAALKTISSSLPSSSNQAGSSNLAPLRVRFSRAENDFQKRRREQSALFKQKMVDQDQWVQMDVEKSKLAKFYEKEIDQIGADASNVDNEIECQEKKLSIEDLLLG